MKLLLDVNFDASRAAMLRAHGLDAVHWSAVGDSRDADSVLIAWARAHRCVVVTQDLGVATSLTASGAAGPSVLQLRHADDLSPDLMDRIAAVAKRHAAELERGCIVVLDARTNRARARPLPAARRR